MDVLTLRSGSVEIQLYDGDRIAPRLKSGGQFEPQSLEVWQTLITRGSQVIDVGAYSGVYSFIASKCGAFPVAIEPMPPMQERLLENAQLNNIDIELYYAAASDRVGKSIIHYNATPLTSGASLSPVPNKRYYTRSVVTLRLDDLQLGEVSAIKIDVERHELQVLRGARDLIRTQRPALLIEILDHKDIEKVCEELVDYKPEGLFDTRNVLFLPIKET